MKFNVELDLKNFRKDFAVAMKDLEAKYGVKVELGNIVYSSTEFHSKISVTTGDKEEAAKIEKENFARLAAHYGFEPSDYMGLVVDKKCNFRLVGFNTKAPKNPCILRAVGTNEEYRAPASLVLRQLVRCDW